MKALTTIQITIDEDMEISQLKRELKLPSKKAVVMEGVRTLSQFLKDKKRRLHIQNLSLKISKESGKINKEWAPLSTSLKHDEN
ncbi:MAG: hypothetical protein A3G32_08460 [Deltaproteobacteria bacterium RIFCSPLOWO2_12_FULL_40_28]|nr:MAG: hypothetical protein A3C45_01160 [Deltaproteobacteria bacterium RIFCSPHIGHO2_02_FULL_40_28]OGQ20937.1 MAG: hypothetical protein A3E27_03825 [Deltaproteobacteria bacterium RIFCSPHIGHO2_12_FULL_40_32]OGQ39338.1 MAG: hypothetical protein A3I69_05185 [Deltaproteobacteria bacterium RIFCSPLOWO2_02_FULL_40_36]OGQ54619.1 MAG: hypothetical protein A3G32_08460 [Deltaproteobacteria bacterium RIFCSPLOWO2_12_FULL_40_28]